MLGAYAWFSTNSGNQSHPTGELQPNDLGLFDMHGNAAEWCQDRYAGKQKEARALEDKEDSADCVVINSKDTRMLRGGAFNDLPRFVRSTTINRHEPGTRASNIGFRPVKTITRE